MSRFPILVFTKQSPIRETKSDVNRVEFIDAVRGYAFLGVVCYHVALAVGLFHGRALALVGANGVQLFFLASAITLARSMATRRSTERRATLNFYIRRFFRIAPLFWLSLVFYWFIWPSVIPPMWLKAFAPYGVHPSYFWATMTFTHGWHPYTFNSIVPGGWSIAVEMTFYAVFPLLFAWIDSAAKAAFVTAVSLGWMVGLHVSLNGMVRDAFFPDADPNAWVFFERLWFPAQFVVFALGMWLYHLLQHRPVTEALRSRAVAVSLAVVSATGAAWLASRPKLFLPEYCWFAIVLAGFVLSLASGCLPWITNRIVRRIGELSYSCYLVHFAALGIALRSFGISLMETTPYFEGGTDLTNSVYFIGLTAVTLAITLPVAAITLRLVENPGIRCGKSLIRFLESRPV
jgi:peptidoglycan/LPS O-acetylase OafA/YrhL